MEHNPLPFNHKKATQALNYLAYKAGGRINKMKAVKLVFLADRYHLRKYGRLVTNDNYVAMKLGPVPSRVLDIAESDIYLSEDYKDYASNYIKALDGGRQVESIGSVDESFFSESDIEALEFSWNNFSSYRRWDLSDFTHNYPEWKRHEQAIRQGSKFVEMELQDFLDDPPDGVNKCFELSEEEKADRKEQLTEQIHVESLWR
jgi:uncharacterized phage-associated protein